MPIAGVPRSEGPNHIRPTQAGLNVRIRSDVVRVIVIDEFVAADREVNHAGRQNQGQTEQTSDACVRDEWFTGHNVGLSSNLYCLGFAHDINRPKELTK